MERNLVQHGASTLMISLPKKWLDKQSLKKGDSIFITPLEDKIVINVNERQPKQLLQHVFIPEANYDAVRTALGMLYRKGYDEISIKYDDPACFFFIQEVVNLLYGFEIVEHTKTHVRIKNISKGISIKTEDIINRIINIIKAESAMVKEYLSNGTKGKNEEFQRLRDECWKLRNLVFVYLKENLLSSSFEEYSLVHIVEQNATFLYWLYNSFDASKINKPSREFLLLYDEIINYFSQSVKMRKNPDESYIKYIMSERKRLLKACELYSSKKREDGFLVIYLSMLIQNIHNPKSLIV